MNFSIEFTETALEDYQYWKKAQHHKITDRIKLLLASMSDSPFKGIGKSESLKYDLSEYWSRRITKEHRIVYKLENDVIYVVQLRSH